MITKIVQQILLISTMGNIWRTVWRIYMLISRLKIVTVNNS